MDQIKRNLYELLFSCKGNWRNAIYVPCGPCPHPCKVDRSGCLAAIRQDGAPLLVGVRGFEEETGERIDPGDCRCIALCRASVSYREEMGAFPAYARTVIRNYLLDRCREIQSARKNLPLLSLDAFAEMGAPEPVSPFHTEDLLSDVSSAVLLSHFRNRCHGTARLGSEAMGQYSGSLMRVQLAVGLPPAHFGVQAKRFINYFNGRGFQFKGKPYAIFIENTACFPQSFSAAAATVKNLASFPRALVVDIGGFTADYVRLRNGVPDMAACDSLENGVILLYNRICAKANAELDILLEESEIDRILRGEDQDAAPEVSVPVPDQAVLEEMILAILAKNQNYLKKQPEPKPSPAQQDAAISAASEPVPPANGRELEQWFGGQDGVASILNSLKMFEQD